MRYIVVGTSGSGKSTFARALSAVVQAPHIELDELQWGPDWASRPFPELAQAVRDATTGDRWVVDGNYSALSDIFWPNATHIVWLNFSRRVVFSRVIRRTLKRVITRERLWAGNTESFHRAFLSKDSVIRWSFTTYHERRRQYGALRAMPEYSHLQWHELRTPRQLQAFLRSCGEQCT